MIKKTLISLFVFVVGISLMVGCNSDTNGKSNADMIKEGNEGLPPIDPNAPAPTAPVRDDLKGGGNMPAKGG